MEKINLDKIIESSFKKYNFNLVNWASVVCKDAMKEACKQVLELAAENVKTKPLYTKACNDHTPYWGPCCSCGQYDNPDIKIGDYCDKQSILDIINQIE